MQDVKIPLFVHVYIKCKFYGKRDKQPRKIFLANKKSKRMWPLDLLIENLSVFIVCARADCVLVSVMPNN